MCLLLLFYSNQMGHLEVLSPRRCNWACVISSLLQDSWLTHHLGVRGWALSPPFYLTWPQALCWVSLTLSLTLQESLCLIFSMCTGRNKYTLPVCLIFVINTSIAKYNAPFLHETGSHVFQAGPKPIMQLRTILNADPPASTSRGLELPACAPTPALCSPGDQTQGCVHVKQDTLPTEPHSQPAPSLITARHLDNVCCNLHLTSILTIYRELFMIYTRCLQIT